MDQKNIYFAGIGGTAMGSVAVALKNEGYAVSGVDDHVYPPMSGVLQDNGIRYFNGYDKTHIEDNLDLVVIGNALSRGNPEVEAVLNRKIPYVSLPELVRNYLIGDKRSFVVTGTHGKSTTTSLLAWIFHAAGIKPGYMIGGVPNNLPQSCTRGAGDVFIIEGDEYDTAFFDKRSKFLHYAPECLIINNIELDHVDIFFDVEDVLRSFRHLVSIVPSTGRLVVNGDDENVMSLIRNHPVIEKKLVPFSSYGKNGSPDFKITGLHDGTGGISFTLNSSSHGDIDLQTSLSGSFQACNVSSAVIAALHYGLPANLIQDAVREFRGLKRRMEIRGDINGVTIVDDFAHHPTAVAATLAGARNRFPGRRIWVVLEPRSNSMRRKVFEHKLADSLAIADSIVIAGVYNPEAVQANERLDPGAVVDELVKSGKKARYIPDVDDIIAFLAEKLDENDVVIGMSNGGFGGFYDKLINMLSAKK